MGRWLSAPITVSNSLRRSQQVKLVFLAVTGNYNSGMFAVTASLLACRSCLLSVGVGVTLPRLCFVTCDFHGQGFKHQDQHQHQELGTVQFLGCQVGPPPFASEVVLLAS